MIGRWTSKQLSVCGFLPVPRVWKERDARPVQVAADFLNKKLRNDGDQRHTGKCLESGVYREWIH